MKSPTSRYGPQTRPTYAHAPTDLIHAIYGAALDPASWPRVLGRIGQFAGGQQVILFSLGVDPSSDDFFWGSDSIPLDSQVNYVRHYWQHDPWAGVLAAAPDIFRSGSVQIDHDVVDQDEFDRSVFLNEFLRDFDIHRNCGSVINNGSLRDIPAMSLSVFRSSRTEHFADGNAACLAAVVPHLQRSLRLGYRLARDRLSFGAPGFVFEHAADAVLLVDARSRVAHPNARAREILARGDGLSLTRTGTLIARTPKVNARLAALIGATSRTTTGTGSSPGGTIAVERGGGRQPYVLNVSPLPQAHTFRAGALHSTAIITVHEPDARMPSRDPALQQAFGLTSAECRVTNGILEGLSAREMSERFGTSMNTVQSQVKRVYEKTGVRRQADLIRLVFTLPGEP